jgi:hypothetical protein
MWQDCGAALQAPRKNVLCPNKKNSLFNSRADSNQGTFCNSLDELGERWLSLSSSTQF